jgi:translation initiation factor 3 subunit B
LFKYGISSVLGRAAQRAFRERKQSQLAELQARIQQYEQGEIERNVALQGIAKRLKEENEALRRENSLLKEKITKLEQDQQATKDKKRWRDNSPGSVTSPKAPARKKPRFSPETFDKSLSNYLPSSPPMLDSPHSSSSSDSRFSPIYEVQSSETTHPIIANIDLNNTNRSISLDSIHFSPSFNCGFCSDDTPCVCRELAAQQVAERSNLTAFKSEEYTGVVHLEPAPQSLSTRSSILDNLPAYRPPVPLRRRVTPCTVNSIFPVQVLSETRPSTQPTCSGDPSNCLACADDAFGKAFCSAIKETIATRPSCVDYPGGVPSSSHNPCNSLSNCEHCMPDPAANLNGYDSSESIPMNAAWQQIKAHPNASFADLSLLANVVASRSRCVGPRIPLSPCPESKFTPPTPPLAPPADNETIILTDPHAQYKEKEKAQLQGASPPPRDVLARCGRIREVPTSAVRDALRLLDVKFP